MNINWPTFAWAVVNLVFILFLCALPVALTVWMAQTHKRLARIEEAIEELRRK